MKFNIKPAKLSFTFWDGSLSFLNKNSKIKQKLSVLFSIFLFCQAPRIINKIYSISSSMINEYSISVSKNFLKF